MWNQSESHAGLQNYGLVRVVPSNPESSSWNVNNESVFASDLATVDVLSRCFAEEEVDVVVDVVRRYEVWVWKHVHHALVERSTETSKDVNYFVSYAPATDGRLHAGILVK